MNDRNRPKISVVIVIYNIEREARRSLYSLSADYQQQIEAHEYEVIVVDNGSEPAFVEDIVRDLRGAFRCIRISPASKSPAEAVNFGLAAAKGDVIGVMVDGARIATPALLHYAWHGAQLHETSVVASLGWYIGNDTQRLAMAAGYDKAREDALLQSIDWRADGYRLYEVAAMDESTVDGWFHPISESNAIFLRRANWTRLGGFDERFDYPGGGLVNLDFLARACELPDAHLVILLGEGTFHQLHGGVATNSPPEAIATDFQLWAKQYEAIRGKRYEMPVTTPRVYVGVLPKQILPHFARALVEPAREPPPGSIYQNPKWQLLLERSADPTVASLMDLAQAELHAKRFEAAASIARLARAAFPDAGEPQQLLGTVGAWMHGLHARSEREPALRLARAKAWRVLQDDAAAEQELLTALQAQPDFCDAQVELSRLRLPGKLYFALLEALHERLRPATYLEIGVDKGASLALARAGALAIGVDPNPRVNVALSAETHIFCKPSDEFFANNGWSRASGGAPIDLAFIDGLHTFEQALKDFINVEANCHSRSVVLIHDTAPLDEITQRPERETEFWTGNVWRMVPCLTRFRPDLKIVTIAAPWSGLTVVTGLDPNSGLLAEALTEITAYAESLTYADLEADRNGMLRLVPNNDETLDQILSELPALAEAQSSQSKSTRARSDGALYLDLLVKTICNSIYGDPSIHPDSMGVFDDETRREGKDWPSQAHSMMGELRLKNLRELAERALTENVAGDFIETGVWRGGGCILMRGVLAAHGLTDRRVYVCDCFEGLPPPNVEQFPSDRDLDLSGIKALAVSEADVRRHFKLYDLLDDQVVFVKGWFTDTLTTLSAGPFALIRLDGDLYESTWLALESLYPKLSPGGYVIVDDYSIPQCRQAVTDYRAAHSITESIHEIDWTGVWWQKPKA